MPLPPDRRDQLLSATREAAAAFVEDMPHLRKILNKTGPDRGELRLMSNVLRRLLIDNGGDLPDIAAPRVGRVTLLSPDNKSVFMAAQKRPYAFFGSAGVSAFGIWMRASAAENGPHPMPLSGFDPEKMITLPIHNFLEQKVLCLQGSWIKRRDAIKYIANIASGVHSGAAKDDIEKLIARLRTVASYKVVDDMASLSLDISALNRPEPQFRYIGDAIDPVLLEMLAAARFIADSPDIQRLEAIVAAELATFS